MEWKSADIYEEPMKSNTCITPVCASALVGNEQHVYSIVDKEKKKSSRLGQEGCQPGQQIEGVYTLAT